MHGTALSPPARLYSPSFMTDLNELWIVSTWSMGKSTQINSFHWSFLSAAIYLFFRTWLWGHKSNTVNVMIVMSVLSCVFKISEPNLVVYLIQTMHPQSEKEMGIFCPQRHLVIVRRSSSTKYSLVTSQITFSVDLFHALGQTFIGL